MFTPEMSAKRSIVRHDMSGVWYGRIAGIVHDNTGGGHSAILFRGYRVNSWEGAKDCSELAIKGGRDIVAAGVVDVTIPCTGMAEVVDCEDAAILVMDAITPNEGGPDGHNWSHRVEREAIAKAAKAMVGAVILSALAAITQPPRNPYPRDTFRDVFLDRYAAPDPFPFPRYPFAGVDPGERAPRSGYSIAIERERYPRTVGRGLYPDFADTMAALNRSLPRKSATGFLARVTALVPPETEGTTDYVSHAYYGSGANGEVGPPIEDAEEVTSHGEDPCGPGGCGDPEAAPGYCPCENAMSGDDDTGETVRSYEPFSPDPDGTERNPLDMPTRAPCDCGDCDR